MLDPSLLESNDGSKRMAPGLMPGADLSVMQRFPTYVVSVGYTQLAVDIEAARLILVRPA